MLGTVAEPLPSGVLGKGIEFQSAGKYIVGVGSMHKSGKRYTWDRSAMPGTDSSPQGVPPWVVKIITARVTKPKAERTPEEADAFYSHIMAPAANGERRHRVSQLLGYLFGTPFPHRGVLACLVISHVMHTYPDLTDFGEEEIKELARDFIHRDDIKRGIAA